MAISGTISNHAEQSGTTTTCTVDTGDGWSTPTSGNILVAILAMDGDGTTPGITTRPTDFTLIDNYFAGAGWWIHYDISWKVSDGTETSFTWTYTGGAGLQANGQVFEVDSTGLNTSNYDGYGEDTSNLGNGDSYTSFGTGSVTPTTADSLCIAMIGMETTSNWSYQASRSLSIDNSFNIQIDYGDGTNFQNPSFAIATKVLSASASTSATWSTDGVATRVYGAMLAFASAAPTIDSGPTIGKKLDTQVTFSTTASLP